MRLDCNFISALQHWFGGAGSASCEYLDVSQNTMTSIAPMSFPRVHTLAAMCVPIAALPCMRRCFPALTELRLDGCHVTSAAIAKAFEECSDGKAVPLRVLSVSGCPLASLRPLQHLSNLEVTPAYFGALNPFCIQRFSPPKAALQEVIARNCRMGEGGGGGGDCDAARLLPPPPPAKSWPALQILQVRF